MGFRSEAVRFRAFVKTVGDGEMHLLEPVPVLRFLESNGPLTTFWFSKYHALKAFYRYELARDYCANCSLPLSVPEKPEAFQPYNYTNQDTERLVDAADSRHRYRWLLEPHFVRTLLLLLHGTGLRIGEALHLTLEDFDADTGVLTIRETKFFKGRFVPVGDGLRRVLCSYIERQWPQRSRSEMTPLLETVKGSPIMRQTAELVFKRLREQAGVSRSNDATFQPRPHDFRPTFAVVRLVTCYREGKNVQRLLLHLSVYLGHGRLRDTQRYLSMTTELLQQASLCFERYARPEVPHA
jgi:integrase/recombinase XerD